MSPTDLKRRSFLKGSIGAGLALSFSPLLPSCKWRDAKGLPTAALGKTGMRVPRIAFGLGSRFCTIDEEEVALELLSHALDNGLYLWDTAHTYVNNDNGAVSEERIGKILKDRRDEVLISTKVRERGPDEAMRQIEGSLKRLQTDRLDILKVHAVGSMEEVDQMSRKGQLIDLLQGLKAEGVCRFVGFSGHGSAQAMKAMADRGDFDTMQIAMNHWGNHENDRKGISIPAAMGEQMGVILMKAVRPRDQDPSIDGSDLIRYALSLKGPSTLSVGMESKEVMDKNLELLRGFSPMEEDEMRKMARALLPFYKHEKLEWMDHHYQDGYWQKA